MRTAALCLAAVAMVLLALSPAADAQATALRKCYISGMTLSGPPVGSQAVNMTFNMTTKDQRTCFYTCDVKVSAFYTYNNASRLCTCFKTNVDGTVPAGLIATPAPTSVYGNIQACFPFCSVAVKSCARCRVAAKGIMCVANFSKTRCCCTPPSRVSVKKGKIVGCTIDDRMLREMAQDPLTGKKMAWAHLFQSLMPVKP